jgi:hypothetical protein
MITQNSELLNQEVRRGLKNDLTFHLGSEQRILRRLTGHCDHQRPAVEAAVQTGRNHSIPHFRPHFCSYSIFTP